MTNLTEWVVENYKLIKNHKFEELYKLAFKQVQVSALTRFLLNGGVKPLYYNMTYVPQAYLAMDETIEKVYRDDLSPSVKIIEKEAFWNCKNLTDVVIRNGVEYIGDSAFSECPKLSNIILPNTLKSIGPDAFSVCRSLQSIIVPDSVVEIGKSAFDECKRLSSVYIGGTNTIINEYAFDGCATDLLIHCKENSAPHMWCKKNGKEVRFIQ